MAKRGRRASVAVLLAATLLVGCGSDGDDRADDDTGADEATETTTTPATSGGDGSDETLEVTGVDYAFEGIPETIEAGTEIRLDNQSDTELHELVAVSSRRRGALGRRAGPTSPGGAHGPPRRGRHRRGDRGAGTEQHPRRGRG
ncbi:MAG: hypothetical protein U5R31_06350 [Acidimicrobiia bacterium]|nr:hypothetical protein [Acidimicrobiia bacterium]